MGLCQIQMASCGVFAHTSKEWETLLSAADLDGPG
jgi:hypothetical protein